MIQSPIFKSKYKSFYHWQGDLLTPNIKKNQKEQNNKLISERMDIRRVDLTNSYNTYFQHSSIVDH